MKALRKVASSDLVALATAAGTLGLPPTTFGLVPAWWSSTEVIPEIELSIWAAEAVALTNAVLYGARLHALTFADITVTAVPAVKASLDLATKTTHCNTVIEARVAGIDGNAFTIAFVSSGGAPNAGALTNVGLAYTFTFKNGTTTVTNFETAIAASADLEVKTPGTGANILAVTVDEFGAAHLTGGVDSELNHTAHGLKTGDGGVQVTSTGTFPALLAALTDYFVVVDNANNVSLAATFEDAMNGDVIEFTSAGSGTIKIVATADTERVYWETHDGLLGLAGDGAISLNVQTGYSKRLPHSPLVVGYALVGTLDTGALSAAIAPIQDSGGF